MKVAIDFDKTMFDCNSPLYQVANILFTKQKKDKKLKFDIVNEDDRTKSAVIKSLGKISNPKYFTAIKDSVPTLKSWQDDGATLVVLASRPNLAVLRKTMLYLFKLYDLSFDAIVVACNNKARFCERFNIDLLIDDTYSICEKCRHIDIPSIWFRPSVTEFDKSYYDRMRFMVARNWLEIDKFYHKVKDNIEKKKQLKNTDYLVEYYEFQ